MTKWTLAVSLWPLIKRCKSTQSKMKFQMAKKRSTIVHSDRSYALSPTLISTRPQGCSLMISNSSLNQKMIYTAFWVSRGNFTSLLLKNAVWNFYVMHYEARRSCFPTQMYDRCVYLDIKSLMHHNSIERSRAAHLSPRAKWAKIKTC